MVKDNTVTYKQ